MDMASSNSKGSILIQAETHALLEGVRAHYGIMRTKLGSSVTAEMKHDIWTDITKRVNATGSGQLWTLDQVKLRWKNFKQKATKDHSEAQKPKTDNKPGGESSLISF